jgi:hypothetical protein
MYGQPEGPPAWKKGTFVPEASRTKIHDAQRAEVAPFFAYMREYGMSLSHLAKKLGLSVQSVHFYQTGYRRTPTEFIPKAYRAIGSPIDLLSFVEQFVHDRVRQANDERKATA